MSTAIKISHITKSFLSQSSGKRIHALNGIDLEVKKGEVLGILGPNSAGKTTLLNILSTLLLPDEGQGEILGIPIIPKNFQILRRRLNMSSGSPNFHWSLTLEENLRFYGRLYGLRGVQLATRVNSLSEKFSLGEFRQRRFDELSSGTKQRLALAKAMINDPEIIFLDEPTVGLDPDVAIRIRKLIKDIFAQSKATILLTTHNMSEVEELCQRVAFIRQGKIIRLASPGELKSSLGKNNLEDVFVELAHQEGTSKEHVVPAKAGTQVWMPAFAGMTKEQRNHIAIPLEENVFSIVIAWLNRCWAFTIRNFLFAKRNFFAFAELIFWPVVSLISIGLLGDFAQLEQKALAFVLTGAITAGVLQVTQLDVAYGLLYEVWSKSVKHTSLTPVGLSENIFGSWLIGILRGAVIFLILSLCAIFFFGFPMPSLTQTAIYLSGIFACALLLGMGVNVLILAFGQKAEITAWMLAYVAMLISGIYYPVNTLPKIFFSIAQWIPITYFLEFYRTNFGFAPIMEHSLLKGFGLIIMYFAIGQGLMALAFVQARRSGTLVRLSE